MKEEPALSGVVNLLTPGPFREARMLSGFPGRMAPSNLTESDLREVEKRRFVLSRSLPNAQSKQPHN